MLYIGVYMCIALLELYIVMISLLWVISSSICLWLARSLGFRSYMEE